MVMPNRLAPVAYAGISRILREAELFSKESKLATTKRELSVAEGKLELVEKKITAHTEVIKNTEALIAGNEKSMGLMVELMDCYKALIANNEAADKAKVDTYVAPTAEEREISAAAYEKSKTGIVDLINLACKTNKQVTKIVEKPTNHESEPSVESKSRATAYSILYDCFNKFRLNYLFSMFR
jgi:hypothetical protein